MQFYSVSVKTLSFHFTSDPDPLRQKVPDLTGSRTPLLDRTVSNFGVIHNLPVFLLFPGQTSYLGLPCILTLRVLVATSGMGKNGLT